MLRHVIIYNTLCMLLAASFNIITPGPDTQPSKGGVWPQPQHQCKTNAYFKLFPHNFTITIKGESCDILTNAIQRYTDILRSTERIALRHSRIQKNLKKYFNVTNTNYNFMGSLQELQINLTKPCESYPQLYMDERYSLIVAAISTLNSASIWGILRGLETFVQLSYMTKGYDNLFINATQIDDFPKYTHRGLLIDTSRHYLSISTILKLLDAMEMNKMNVLHWHIVDDESFPYQSEKFPRLSEAAYDPTMIYTATNITRIVNYARDRGIRVLPEFDVPGHTSSWGLTYPSILTKCYQSGKEVGLGPMDPTKNVTYNLIKDLFREVQDRFPDEYFHVGGDEVEMSCWTSNPEIQQFMTKHNMTIPRELYSYFWGRVIPLLGKRSKPIVWQEVYDESVSLPKGTIVQVWKDAEPREMIDILRYDHRIIYSTTWFLDQIGVGGDWLKYYSSDPRESVERLNPHLNLTNILGGEALMWGEVVDDTNVISRVWPRASAVAEILWTGSTYWSPLDVMSRLEEHVCRMNRRGIHAQPVNGPGFCITAN